MQWRIALVAWICLCLALSAARPQSNIIGGGLYGDRKAGFSLCSGTVVSLTSPNDLTNAAWAPTNLTATVNSQTDPLGGSTAGALTAASTNANVNIRQAGSGLVINTTYEISGYLKNTVTPVWMQIEFSDLNANSFGTFVNLSTGAVGSNSNVGGGSAACFNIAAAGQSYWHWSFAGSTTAITGTLNFALVFASANGTNGGTINQAFNYYTIGP